MTSSQHSPEAYRLLFTDKTGRRLPFTDVVAEGLEPGYEDRIPRLVELASRGTAYERLLATCMLASWAQRSGLLQIIEWARDPHGTPWADEPVVVGRLSDADRAFDMMGDALQVSYFVDAAPIADLRDEAMQALLRIYHRFFFRDGLALA